MGGIVGTERNLSYFKPVQSDLALLGELWRLHPRYQGCIGHWLLGEGGGITAYDISGYNTNGTLTNMDPSTDWVPGLHGMVVNFDGTNDYINGGNSSLFNFNQSNSTLSISAWVRVISFAGNSKCIFSRWGVGQRQYSIDFSSTGAFEFITSTDGNAVAMRVATTATFLTDQWYHTVATADIGRDIYNLYIDGIELPTTGGTTLTTLFNSTANVIIGATKDGTDDLFNGDIGDVRVYNRILSNTEISSLYLEPFLEFTDVLGERILAQILVVAGLFPPWHLRQELPRSEVIKVPIIHYT